MYCARKIKVDTMNKFDIPISGFSRNCEDDYVVKHLYIVYDLVIKTFNAMTF